MAAMVLVLPGGRTLAGADAVPELLRAMKGWRWLASAFAVPGVTFLARPAYRWVARNRYSLSCLIESRPKKEPPKESAHV